MAIKAVKAIPDDEPLDLADLEKPITDRFKWGVEEVVRAADQWKMGLLSDDEISWRVADFTRANQDRNKLKTARRHLEALAKVYLGRK